MQNRRVNFHFARNWGHTNGEDLSSVPELASEDEEAMLVACSPKSAHNYMFRPGQRSSLNGIRRDFAGEPARC